MNNLVITFFAVVLICMFFIGIVLIIRGLKGISKRKCSNCGHEEG